MTEEFLWKCQNCPKPLTREMVIAIRTLVHQFWLANITEPVILTFPPYREELH